MHIILGIKELLIKYPSEMVALASYFSDFFLQKLA